MEKKHFTTDQSKQGKLKFIHDKQFKELTELVTNPVRPDSEIDRDCRTMEFEDFLQFKGFEYKETSLSSSGGVRSYDNKPINKTVEVMRSPDSSGMHIEQLKLFIG